MPAADLLTPRQAAQLLGVSYPTLKQWIYKKTIRTVPTPGGHHRIPRAEVERRWRRAGAATPTSQTSSRRISGRNQLLGRITEIRRSGLLAQVKLDVAGQTVTAVITAESVRELGLRVGATAAAVIKSTEVMIALP